MISTKKKEDASSSFESHKTPVFEKPYYNLTLSNKK